MLYSFMNFWRRLNEGARMLVLMWLGFITMLLVMGAFGLL